MGFGVWGLGVAVGVWGLRLGFGAGGRGCGVGVGFGVYTSTINSSIGSSRNSHQMRLPQKKLTLRKGFGEQLSEMDKEAVARMSGPGFNDTSS